MLLHQQIVARAEYRIGEDCCPACPAGKSQISELTCWLNQVVIVSNAAHWTSELASVVISRKKAADTGSLLTQLYLFSFKSIIYEANGEELYNFTRGVTVSRISNQYAASTVSVRFLRVVSWRRGLHNTWYTLIG